MTLCCLVSNLTVLQPCIAWARCAALAEVLLYYNHVLQVLGVLP